MQIAAKPKNHDSLTIVSDIHLLELGHLSIVLACRSALFMFSVIVTLNIFCMFICIKNLIQILVSFQTKKAWEYRILPPSPLPPKN